MNAGPLSPTLSPGRGKGEEGFGYFQGEALSDTKWRISGRGIYFRGRTAGGGAEVRMYQPGQVVPW